MPRSNQASRDAHSAIACLSALHHPILSRRTPPSRGRHIPPATLTLEGTEAEWDRMKNGLSSGRRSGGLQAETLPRAGVPSGTGAAGAAGVGGGSRPGRSGGRLRLLTFSVSRSFTVGNGVRADILCGRRGRAGVSPAGLRCGLRGSEERGGRGRAERSHRPRGGATSGPGADRGRGRGGRGGGPLPAAAPGTRAAAREGSGRGRLPARAGRRRGVDEPGAAAGPR